MRASQDRMTKEEFALELDRIGLNQIQAASMLGVNERTVRRWKAGDRPIPATVIRLLAAQPDAAPQEPPSIPPPTPIAVNAQRAAQRVRERRGKATRKRIANA